MKINLNWKKKNKIISIFILTFVFGLSIFVLWAQEKDYSKSNLRYVDNQAFGFGEKLEYKVGYKFISAGTGYFHIKPEPIYKNGRPCYDIQFQVRSLESLEWLFKVKDNYSTAMDVSALLPWQFEQHVREGNYKRDFKARFDQVENKAYAENKVYNVPSGVHDIVSAMYYVRTMNFNSWKKDSIVYLQNFFGDSTYKLGVKMLGRQTVEVEAGKFKCVVIEPLVVEGGLFKNEGSIVVWLTDDERKVPVKVGTKVVIGFVGAELTKYSGLRGPLKSKIE